MAKKIIMEVTVPLIAPTNEEKTALLKEGYVSKFTEDDIGYLIKEEQDEIKDKKSIF